MKKYGKLALVLAIIFTINMVSIISVYAYDDIELSHQQRVYEYLKNWTYTDGLTTYSIDVDRIPEDELEQYYASEIKDLDSLILSNLNEAFRNASSSSVASRDIEISMNRSPASIERTGGNQTYTAARNVVFTHNNLSVTCELVWSISLYYSTDTTGNFSSLNGSTYDLEPTNMTYSNVYRSVYTNYGSYAIVAYNVTFSTIAGYYVLDKTEILSHTFYA